MFIASLIFSNTDWLWPLAGGTACAIALLWWGYRATPPGAIRRACVALKLTGSLGLAICLLEPLWVGQRVRPGANLFAILADTSQGMMIRDAGETQTRGGMLQTLLLNDVGGWQVALEDDFTLRRFTVDTRLQATRDFDSLEFDGGASAIGSALQNLRQRFQGRPLAGVLLFTDGNATDLTGSTGDFSGLPPIYPVAMGRTGGARDVSIANLNITQSAFEDAPVTMQADIRAVGLRGEAITVQLLDAEGANVREQSLRVRRDDETMAVRFRLRPENPDLSFYQLKASLQSDLESANGTQGSREATLLNNSRVIAVDRGGGPYRVLYVSGRPNWEYKFLNRAVVEDPEVQLVGLIRVARREARFDFRGRSGETSNPLFRGVENQSPEELARYDEPVIMRLNTRDEFELRGGFPSAAEDLYGYTAVILDDVEAGFFTAEQMALLQRYVSERGGGLIMLGGMESFQQGGYRRTPVGEMLPVYLDSPQPRPSGDSLRLDLTREGWLEAWARLRANEQDETMRLQSMPPFHVVNSVGDIKPGASVVVIAVDDQDQLYPVLITQRFGRGRTGALTVGDVWRWGMQNPQSRADMDKFWRQLVRWLVADVPERIELTISDGAGQESGSLLLQVRVKDERFEPVSDASVVINVKNVLMPGNNSVTTNFLHLRAEASLEEAGLYEAQYVARNSGGYHAVAEITDAVGATMGRAEAGWSADLTAKEFASLEPNISLLEDIARRTGGHLVPAEQLKTFVRDLPQQEAMVMEPWTRPVWHTPGLFLFALACFVSEWGLRRWKGMP